MPLGDNTRLTTEEFISRSNLVHNFFYDYSKTQYIDSKKKVIIICPIHGDFLQRPSNHINLKQGCYYCGNEIKSKTLLRAQRDFINISKNIHGDKYNYDKVDYKGSTKKVTIICPIHGEFLQTPSAHIVQKQGCPICGNARKNNTRQIDVKEFIDKANIIHKNKYTYKTETFVNMTTKMSITCPIHGDFWQQPNNHNNRQGCPMCKKSYGEIQIREYLIKKTRFLNNSFDLKDVEIKKLCHLISSYLIKKYV